MSHSLPVLLFLSNCMLTAAAFFRNKLQEWITPQPSRRPDIFPEFEKLETPMPKPLPGDPELPDEEEEEEEEKKKKNPDEPDKEDEPKPDEPAPSQE